MLDYASYPIPPSPRIRQRENFWRSCRGGQWDDGPRPGRLCRTRFLRARLETVLGRVGSQSGRFGALQSIVVLALYLQNALWAP